MACTVIRVVAYTVSPALPYAVVSVVTSGTYEGEEKLFKISYKIQPLK